MSAFELINEIEKLPVSEQLLVVERAMHSIRIAEVQKRMSRAAELLRDDYTNDPELTAFSALDADDFYEST